MRAKVFKERSIREAVARVKEELGSDAMILATRKVPRSPRDPYGTEMFEVEAAPKDQSVVQAGPEPGFTQFFEPIRDELISIKDLLSMVGLGSGIQTLMLNHGDTGGIFASLLRTGMSEKTVQSVLCRASALLEKEDAGHKKLKSTGLKPLVIKDCLARLDVLDPFIKSQSAKQPHVAAFVGPTGVGKTTTIAKIAAELSLRRKLKVGLVSIDNYRVGAFEQLKVYASIMRLRCVPAFSGADVSKALDRMRDMDVVLMDTAGHSHCDSARMKEIEGAIKGDYRISVHLVLSATTGLVDMKAAAKAFSVFDPETYVFTKIDETRQCGKLMDQVCEMPMPVSLITNGQRVPEDLIIPDKKELLSIILGSENR